MPRASLWSACKETVTTNLCWLQESLASNWRRSTRASRRIRSSPDDGRHLELFERDALLLQSHQAAWPDDRGSASWMRAWTCASCWRVIPEASTG